ncbi:hypothetical protein M1E17_02230 [Arthrobacter sp. D1-29]
MDAGLSQGGKFLDKSIRNAAPILLSKPWGFSEENMSKRFLARKPCDCQHNSLGLEELVNEKLSVLLAEDFLDGYADPHTADSQT